MVVRRLGAVGVTRETAGLAQAVEVRRPPGDQLVHVGLMSGVPDDGVGRGVEHSVQRDGQLDHAEVGAEMPACGGQRGNEKAPHPISQGGELRRAHGPQSDRVDAVERLGLFGHGGQGGAIGGVEGEDVDGHQRLFTMARRDWRRLPSVAMAAVGS